MSEKTSKRIRRETREVLAKNKDALFIFAFNAICRLPVLKRIGVALRIIRGRAVRQ